MLRDRSEEFRPVFFPESVAVVGASRNERGHGTNYLRAYITAGFAGPLYPINPSGGTILGLQAYPRLVDVPGPVEYVVVSVPVQHVKPVIDDCATKGVKVVQFFTAGFRETGDEEGRTREAYLEQVANQAGFRVVGPNCIGVGCPRHHVPLGMNPVVGQPGQAAFVSQSGGHANTLTSEGVSRGLRFSKIISFGNGCTLDGPDYLEYLAGDPDTTFVGAYLEGTRDGRRLFEVTRELADQKPLVVWKGGRTDAGSAAARSHTGSLAISGAVWESLVRQIGAIHVYALDELVDVLLVLQQIGPFTGRRVGIMAGLTGGGGGISVSATDACAAVGLEVLPFSEATRSGLKDVLPPAGCILRNPLDVGAIGADPAKVGRIVELVLADPNLDALIVHEPVQAVAMTSGPEQLRAVNQLFARYRTEQPKPIIVVSPGRLAAETAAIEDLLASCGIPVFPTLERAALALSRLIGHYANR